MLAAYLGGCPRSHSSRGNKHAPRIRQDVSILADIWNVRELSSIWPVIPFPHQYLKDGRALVMFHRTECRRESKKTGKDRGVVRLISNSVSTTHTHPYPFPSPPNHPLIKYKTMEPKARSFPYKNLGGVPCSEMNVSSEREQRHASYAQSQHHA